MWKTASQRSYSAGSTELMLLQSFLLTAAIALVLFGIGFYPKLVEFVYSTGIYALSSIIQRYISAQFSFAIGDCIYATVAAYCFAGLYGFIRKLFKKEPIRGSLWIFPIQLLKFILLLYIIFKLSWGLNYSRQPVAASLGIQNSKYTQSELLSLGTFLISKVNTLQSSRTKHPKWTIRELEWQASAAYDNAARIYPSLKYKVPTIKPVLFEGMITRLGIEGFYNPLSGEANVNMRLPVTSLPFVSCHEVAHQLGIGREDEANLVGYLAAIHSDNLEFRYCGYYAMLRSVLVEIGKSMPEIYSTLYYTVNKQTISEFERDRAFWLKYNSQMYGYMDMTFDKFLKFNNQPKGTDSYQDIVLWLYNYHKKDLQPAPAISTTN